MQCLKPGIVVVELGSRSWEAERIPLLPATVVARLWLVDLLLVRIPALSLDRD